MDKVDWQKQWALFAPGFDGRHAHIDLEPLKQGAGSLAIPFGAGFGDFSHPTTRLTLSLLLETEWRGRPLVDIGCGSGILSLAALKNGCHQAFALDIEEKALAHTSLTLQGQNAHILRTLKRTIKSPVVVAMNMLPHEQELAWAAVSPRLAQPEQIYTSGVLETRRSSYLAWADALGWRLEKQLQEGEWLAFYFAS